LDVVGGEVMEKSYSILISGGVFVSTVGQTNEELGKKLNITSIKQNTATDASRLERLAGLVDLGKIKPNVDRVFALEKIREAIGYQKTGHPRTKVVLELKK
jgi:NADPH:quinone reductase-like Zn-dependent oxidoreductase